MSNATMPTNYTLGLLNTRAESWNALLGYLREICGLSDADAVRYLNLLSSAKQLKVRNGRYEVTHGMYLDLENVAEILAQNPA